MRLRALALALALSAVCLGDGAAASHLPSITFEPLRPTSLEPVHIRVSLLVPLGIDPQLYFSHVEGNRIVFVIGRIAGPNLPPADVPWTAETFVGPLPKGFYTVVIDSEEDLDFQRTFEVTAPSPALVLQESDDAAFAVSVDYDLPQGPAGIGYGVPLTRESGYIWFFAPENIELTVKILDGRPVNGRYWVFIASMTDLPFTVTIQQCPTSPLVGQPCNVKTYTNPRGVNRNIVDVDAFPDL